MHHQFGVKHATEEVEELEVAVVFLTHSTGVGQQAGHQHQLADPSLLRCIYGVDGALRHNIIPIKSSTNGLRSDNS